jgi:hypothetical protein
VPAPSAIAPATIDVWTAFIGSGAPG